MKSLLRMNLRAYFLLQPMRRALIAAFVLLAMTFSQSLLAAEAGTSATSAPSGGKPEAEEPLFRGKPAERRRGIVLGLAGGASFVNSSGYPNNGSKIGDPAYYGSSGWMVGSGGTYMLMGALTDYLNFGFYFGGGQAENKNWKSVGGGLGIRIEAFPLYTVKPWLRDLGVFAQFGIGTSELTPKTGNYEGASGAESALGGGGFYEWSFAQILGGHFAGGPMVEYAAVDSRSIVRHSISVGGRIVFYGGP